MSHLLFAISLGLLPTAGAAQAHPQSPLDLREVEWDADIVLEEEDGFGGDRHAFDAGVYLAATARP